MFQDTQLNLDDCGNVDFRGRSSGTVFVQSVFGHLGSEKEQIKKSCDVYCTAPPSDQTFSGEKRSTPVSARELSHAVSHNDNLSPTIYQDEDEEIHLPDYATALALSHLCFDNACVIIQFVHQPSYFSRLSML